MSVPVKSIYHILHSVEVARWLSFGKLLLLDILLASIIFVVSLVFPFGYVYDSVSLHLLYTF